MGNIYLFLEQVKGALQVSHHPTLVTSRSAAQWLAWLSATCLLIPAIVNANLGLR